MSRSWRFSRAVWVALVVTTGCAFVGCSEETASTQGDAGSKDGDAGTLPGDAGLVRDRDSGRSPDSGARVDAGGRDGGLASADSGAEDAGGSAPRDAGARAAIAPGDAVFFVGNSFFATSDRVLPEWVTAIGRAVRPPFAMETGAHIVPGNKKLSWFLSQRESQEALESKKYELYVLQPEEREPCDDNDGFEQGVRDWHAAITAAGGKTMLFMTWDLSAEKGTDFFARLVAAYEKIGAELEIPVIPVGQIYDDCNKDPFPGEEAGSYWTTGGELHQTETGSAINAYATFAMLTGIDPMGVPFDAPNNPNSVEMLSYLSEKSWARVAPLVTVKP